MRGGWRLPACVAVVSLAHAGLMAAWLQASASGAPHVVPHRVAAVRLIVPGPLTEPSAPPPGPRLRIDGGIDAARGDDRRGPPSPAAVPVPQAVPTQSALSPERVVAPPTAPQVETIAPFQDFLSPAQVDRIAIAFPSPDVSALAGLAWSGLPIRLRLFVAASGQCVDVQVLRASEDAATLEQLRGMFLATHFIPAQHAGAAVDSYRDIELDVSDVK
jgi:hypothetical protein